MMEDKVIFERSTIKGLADAIRLKRGITNELLGSQLEAEILSIETSENLDAELNAQESALNTLETEIESLDDKEPSTNKLALLLGTQDAVNKPYEITAEDLGDATSITQYQFYQKDGLIKIDIPDNVTTIGNNALESCSALEEVNMPNVTSIGPYAFDFCNNLKEVNAPKATEIFQRAFNACYSLSSVNGPEVTYLASSVFYQCIALTSVNMPSLITVGSSVFNGCTTLVYLTIPATCTQIGANALKCGSSTRKATFRFLGTTPPTITTSTFTASNIEKIIVPKGYGETYKTATNWVTFADYIVEAEE